MLIILAVLMFVVAVVFSVLGQGGGVLYTPIQVWSGIDFHVAATTSLFLIMVMSLSASIVFRKANKIPGLDVVTRYSYTIFDLAIALVVLGALVSTLRHAGRMMFRASSDEGLTARGHAD